MSRSRKGKTKYSPVSEKTVIPERKSTKRLARVAVGLMLVITLAAACVIFLTPEPQSTAKAVVINCLDPPPEPGPARPWELDIAVSTYGSVNTRTRNLLTAIPIVAWSGRGPGMNMVLYHNAANVGLPSSRTDNVGFNLGPGWSIAYGDQLLFDDPADPTQITVVYANGTEDLFTKDVPTGNWVPRPGVFDTLHYAIQGGNGTWIVTHKDQSRHEFIRQGAFDDGLFRLAGIYDAVGAATTVEYEIIPGEPIPFPYRITKITGSGRDLEFSYDTHGRLHFITDPSQAGEQGIPERVWQLSYEGNDRLRQVKDAMGFYNHFTYDAAGRLALVSDKTDALTAQLKESYQFLYQSDGGINEVTDPDDVTDPTDPPDGLVQTFSTICGNDIYSTNYLDRRGKLFAYGYNLPAIFPWPDGNLNRITRHGLNSYKSFIYDSDRNLTESYDESGQWWTAGYDDRGNMEWRFESLDGHQDWYNYWQYDTFNNVTLYADPAGNAVQYLYEDVSRPTLLTKVIEPPDGQGNPAAETLLTYNSQDMLGTITDPNGVLTTFDYDMFGQPAAYTEGQFDYGQGPQPVYWESYNYDGGGRILGSLLSTLVDDGTETCSTFIPCTDVCFQATYNANNRQTGSSCSLQARNQGSGGPLGETSHPIVLPCNPVEFAKFSAEIDGLLNPAIFDPMGRPTLVPLELNLSEGSYSRTHSFQYDNLGRMTIADITSFEPGAFGPVDFAYSYDTAAGTMIRTGSDSVDTFVSLDDVGRVDYMRRGPAGASQTEVDYEYWNNDQLKRATFHNSDGTVNSYVAYSYYANGVVKWIDHLDAAQIRTWRYEYTYHDNGAPSSIKELNLLDQAIYTTDFAYDNRGRLIEERRHITTGTPSDEYWLRYEYDQGGNRQVKYDDVNNRMWDYEYDVDPGTSYDSVNNRLMKVEERDGQTAMAPLAKTSWYFYSCSGNVTRIVSRDEGGGGGGGAMKTMQGGGGLTSGWKSGKKSSSESSTTMKGGLGGCGFGAARYTATRFSYAKNGRTVTHALGEEWCDSDGTGCENPLSYKVIWAREFRYDGARQRYLDRELDPANVSNVVSDTRTHYDGNDPYWSRSLVYGDPDVYSDTGFELGNARINDLDTTPSTDYYHTDMLGATRFLVDSAGAEIGTAAYTAFGELVTGTSDRFGYAGAWGYQTHDEMPYQHVGQRYHNPSTGRFLQRDPIGIRGGLNTYLYTLNKPTMSIDPEGDFVVIAIVSGIAIGVKVATSYYKYKSASDAAYACQPLTPRTNEELQEMLRSRRRALRKAIPHIKGAIESMPGSSLTGSPTPSTDAAQGIVEVIGGAAG